MPFGDRTGPRGQGSRTGRGLGYCSGYNYPGYTRPGFGFGRGRGWRRYPAPREEKELLSQEKDAISKEIKDLKEEMKEIEKRIDDLKGRKK